MEVTAALVLNRVLSGRHRLDEHGNDEVADLYVKLYEGLHRYMEDAVHGRLDNNFMDVVAEWSPLFATLAEEIAQILAEYPLDEAEKIMSFYVDERLQWELLQFDHLLLSVIIKDVDEEAGDVRFDELYDAHPDWAAAYEAEESPHHCHECGEDE